MAKAAWLFWPTAIVLGCSRPEPTVQSSSRLNVPATPASTEPTASATPTTPATPASTDVTAPAPTAGDAAWTAPVPSPPTVSSRPAPCQLLAIGDSLTDPKSGGGGYLEGAKGYCGCHVTNLGRGGDMVNQMRARLATHLSEPHAAYQYVVVFGGVNDLYSDLTAKRSVEKVIADLEKMYRAARATGARVIAVTVAPWGGFRRYFTEYRWQNTRRLNDWIRSTPAPGLTDAVVDAERLLSCGAAEELCAKYAAPFRDGLHFGPEGHRRLSAALTHAMGRNQCVTPPVHGPNVDETGQIHPLDP